MPYRLFGILLLFFSPVLAIHARAAETMFEGYYRITLADKPIGYTIVRYSYDAKAKTFESLSFLRTKIGDSVFQESLKEKSDEKLHPISYQYTEQDGDKLKTIDASFKGVVMTSVTSDGKKARKEVSKLPKGTFLSSFLPYLMLQKSLKINEAFRYSAVAEEDGGSYWGKALLQTKEKSDAYETFKIVNTYKGENFISEMAVVPNGKIEGKYDRAEVLMTDSPSKRLKLQLVAKPNEATEGQLVPNKTLITLFGSVPLGKTNMVSSPPEKKTAPKLIPSPVPPKKHGG